MPVKNFQGDCQTWQGYDKDVHSMKIKHIRKYASYQILQVYVKADIGTSLNLPADVFAAGETRPTKPKKKTLKGGPTEVAANNKRSFSDAGLDVRDDYGAGKPDMQAPIPLTSSTLSEAYMWYAN